MPRRQPKSKKHTCNQVRIIGGNWRGRKIGFPDARGLRPSPDRVRETLFNWLQGYVPGARCLDLFAGSGVLGLEALSRGAREVVFVEKDPYVAKSLQSGIHELNAGDRAGLVNNDALVYLETPGCGTFDIVFIDPPYKQGLVMECVRRLDKNRLVEGRGLLYLEQESDLEAPDLPENWVVLKSRQAGQASYCLAQTPDRGTDE